MELARQVSGTTRLVGQYGKLKKINWQENFRSHGIKPTFFHHL